MNRKTMTNLRLLLSIIISLISIDISGCKAIKNITEEDSQVELYTVFGSCFNNDTIDLVINDWVIYESKIVTSDKKEGYVPCSETLYYKASDKLLAGCLNKEDNLSFSIKSKELKFNISRNRKTYEEIFKLKKGRFFVIEGCSFDGNIVRILQYKSWPGFE